jgi:hypothetical protein
VAVRGRSRVWRSSDVGGEGDFADLIEPFQDVVDAGEDDPVEALEVLLDDSRGEWSVFGVGGDVDHGTRSDPFPWAKEAPPIVGATWMAKQDLDTTAAGMFDTP